MNDRRWRLIATALISLGVLIRLPTLGFPLVEDHAFRQTQTAYTAVMYHRYGINLLETPLPTIGPPGQLPFEFPLYQAVAALAMDAGLQTEVALRLTDLAFFVVAALALLAVLRAFDATAPKLVVLGAFLFSPLSIEWSRASTIEYLALSVTLFAVAATRRLDDRATRGRLAVAIALSIVAFLAKLTTALVWLLPVVMVARQRRPAALAAACGLVAGVLWTWYGDAIKATGPLSSRLTSTGVAGYLLGGLAARLDPTVWAAIVANATAAGLLWVLGIVFVRRVLPAERDLVALCGMVIVVALILFPTLYALHGYYTVAISAALAILVGIGVEAAVRARPRSYVAVVGAVLVAATFAATVSVWSRAFGPDDPDNELVSAAQIRAATQPSDELIIVGRDYSPAILFYADRQGIALPLTASLDDIPAAIRGRSLIFDCGVDRFGTCRLIKGPTAP